VNKYNNVIEVWQSYKINTVNDLEKYLENFRILFAYHSGKIENEEITYNDTREIFENSKVYNYTGSPRVLFEQQNQKLCYEFLKEKIVDKEKISIELVKEIHRVLTSGTYDERRYIENGERPGEFKKHDYVTGINEVGSSAENVASDLKELIDEINEFAGRDCLKAVAYFHAKFEFIHPFADGNGRVGRTLLNYYLLTRNYPPIIIYEEDKNLYYDCLKKYDENEEINPLYEFLKYESEKTWKLLLKSGNTIRADRKGLSDFL
jgi:Fic family protein